MPRILFLSHIPVIPQTFGGGRRVAALARAAATSADVTILALFGSAIGREGCWKTGNLTIIQKRVRTPTKVSRVAQVLLWGQPEYWRELSPEIPEDFDLIQIELPYMWTVPEELGIPFVLDEQNLDWEILRQLESFSGIRFGLRKAISRYARWRLRQREIAALLHARAVIFSSVPDMAAASALLQHNLPLAQVVPACVDRTTLPELATEDESPVVLFLGYLNWFPNEDALRLILREVAPRLPAGVRVRIVGAGRPYAQSPPPNVDFVGEVPDAREEIAKASVCIAPLRFGGGTKFKLVEYFAAAKPVIATTKAVEGFDVLSGRDLIVEDDPARFPDHIANLLTDRRRAQELGRNARSLVENRYVWDLYEPNLKRLYTSLTEAPWTGS